MQDAPVRFLRLPEVLLLIGVKKTKLYAMIEKGEFPKPLKIGGSSLWPDATVAKWQQERMAANA